MNRLFTLLILVIACSCSDSSKIDEFANNFQTKLSHPDAPAYINAGVDFFIEVTKSSSEKYEFTYQQRAGGGLLYYNDTLILEKQNISGKGKILHFRYIPQVKGEHRLAFTLTNNKESTDEQFSCTANDTYFTATAKMDSLDINELYINKKIIFFLNLSKVQDSCSMKQFPTTISILEGDGDVIINNLPAQAQSLNTKATTATYLKEGQNKIEYSSRQPGANVIQFSISNQYNIAQLFRVPLDIKAPIYMVNIVQDSVIYQNTPNRFSLNIQDGKSFLEQYSISYTFLKNTGTLKVNNIEIQDSTSVQKGENIIEFIPEQTGEAAIEFFVKDKYNSTKKNTAIFNVVKSLAQINVSYHEKEVLVNSTNSFNLAISKKDYNGKYKLEIVSEPANTATLKIYGTTYTGGKITVTDPANVPVLFTPLKPGNLKLRIKVTDDFGSETEKELDFNVKNTTGQITVLNHTAALKLFTPTNFNLEIRKENYNDKYKLEIISYPAYAGVIKINDKDYTSGKVDVMTPSNIPVSFTPSVSGDIKLTLKAYDSYGGEITKDVLFSVSNTDIKISVEEPSKDLIIGSQVDFKFSATKPGYSGKLKYEMALDPLNSARLKVNGETYTPGAATRPEINVNTPLSVTFIPSIAGNTILELRVYDDFGGVSKYPISFIVSDPAILLQPVDFVSSALINSENKFTFSTQKAGYTGNFKYSIQMIPEDAGKIKIEDLVYTGGKQDLTNKNNCKVSFTPSITGEIKLILSVFDDRSGSTSKEFIYQVENPELKLEVQKIPVLLILNEKINGNFSVSKEKYAGKFFAEITSAGCKEIKIGNQLYNNKPLQLANPASTAISFIPSQTGAGEFNIRITDEWGSSVEKKNTFTIVSDDIQIDIKNYVPEIKYLENASFTYSVSQPGYTGEHEFKIETNPSGSISAIKTNGRSYQGGYAKLDPSSSMVVDFIPNVEGNINMNLTVKNDKGKETKKSIIYTAVKYPLEISAEDKEGKILINSFKESRLNFSEENYNSQDSFEYIITKISGDFSLENNLQIPYTFGKKGKVVGWSPVLIFLTKPKGLEDVVFKVDINDKYGQSKSETFHYQITNPDAVIEFSNYNTNASIGKREKFNLSISKPFYLAELTCSLSVIGKVENLEMNGNTYISGTSFQSKNGILPFSFTPTEEGELEFHASVTDKFGKTNTNSFKVTAKTATVKTINIPVEIAVERDQSCNNAYYDSYANHIEFRIHDGEKRMDDYYVNFQDKQHVYLHPGGSNTASSRLGSIPFPIYTRELSNNSQEGPERIYLAPDLPQPHCIGYDKSPYVTLTCGFKIIDTLSNRIIFEQVYHKTNRLTSTSTYMGDYITYYSFGGGGFSGFKTPEVKDLQNAKIVVYYQVDPSSFQIETTSGSTSLKPGEQGTCSFTVHPAPHFTGKLKYSIYSQNAGEIEVNGVSNVRNTEFQPNTRYNITFTPPKTGEVSIDIQIETDSEERADVPDIKFSVQ